MTRVGAVYRRQLHGSHRPRHSVTPCPDCLNARAEGSNSKPPPRPSAPGETTYVDRCAAQDREPSKSYRPDTHVAATLQVAVVRLTDFQRAPCRLFQSRVRGNAL